MIYDSDLPLRSESTSNGNTETNTGPNELGQLREGNRSNEGDEPSIPILESPLSQSNQEIAPGLTETLIDSETPLEAQEHAQDSPGITFNELTILNENTKSFVYAITEDGDIHIMDSNSKPSENYINPKIVELSGKKIVSKGRLLRKLTSPNEFVIYQTPTKENVGKDDTVMFSEHPSQKYTFSKAA